jgi:anhydro-N-acetylmuramic acid kinase
MSDLYIGLMSGTSLDGVDGILADFSAGTPRVIAHASRPFPQALRAELMALNTSGPDELHRAALAGNTLVRMYAEVVRQLLASARCTPAAVAAIGAHGQTVRHRPQEFDGVGYTLQLNQPALLAELTGIDVVADFRSRDVAAGGQGAPLAPFFHQSLFARKDQAVGVLNIGGISNITLLRADGSLLGFDCGPGNALMDGWCRQHTGTDYDSEGSWAAGGKVLPGLLQRLLAEPYFARMAPKSTGRDLFKPIPERLIVCGGGALNTHLMQRLASLLPGVTVESSALSGLPPLQVEATAFAWLARKTVRGEKLELKSTTGAKGARMLGCLYRT